MLLRLAPKHRLMQDFPSDANGRRSVRAGAYTFHRAHGHFHISDFLRIQLLRARDGKKTREGRKIGFCFHDFALVTWSRFSPIPDRRLETNCSNAPGGGLSLSPGWFEVYTWQTIDNYVDVSGLESGKYLLLATVNPHGQILESTITDNTAYALIRLMDDDVTILKRGYGRGRNL